MQQAPGEQRQEPLGPLARPGLARLALPRERQVQPVLVPQQAGPLERRQPIPEKPGETHYGSHEFLVLSLQSPLLEHLGWQTASNYGGEAANLTDI